MAPERDRLSEQVHLLGDLLGETIVEQEGRGLFDLVEDVRGLAKAHRAGDGAAGERLLRRVEALPLAESRGVVKAFATYFKLVNLAEEEERVRVMRRREREAHARGGSATETIAAAVGELRASGASAEEVQALRVALSAGQMNNGNLQCPFHGFEFDSSGKCTIIPANGRNGVIPNAVKLITYPTYEAHGLVRLWWGGPAPTELPPPEFFDNLNEDFFYSSAHDPWNAHYSRVIENQLDVVHLPFIHRNTIGRGNRTLIDGPVVEWKGDKMLYTYVFNRLDDGIPPRKPSELSPKSATSVHLEFIFPNLDELLKAGGIHPKGLNFVHLGVPEPGILLAKARFHLGREALAGQGHFVRADLFHRAPEEHLGEIRFGGSRFREGHWRCSQPMVPW